jgi:uncharacterized protein with PQ loop repeat
MQPLPRPPATGAHPAQGKDLLERSLPVLSIFTMLMTVPQVWTIWAQGDARGVSLLSWGAYLLSACLWFFYGLRKRDKTIYVACIGWVLLDAAVVAGVLLKA